MEYVALGKIVSSWPAVQKLFENAAPKDIDLAFKGADFAKAVGDRREAFQEQYQKYVEKFDGTFTARGVKFVELDEDGEPILGEDGQELPNPEAAKAFTEQFDELWRYEVELPFLFSREEFKTLAESANLTVQEIITLDWICSDEVSESEIEEDEEECQTVA